VVPNINSMKALSYYPVSGRPVKHFDALSITHGA